MAVVPQAKAASLSPTAVQVLGRAIGLMEPAPRQAPIAVVYAAGDAASRKDADDIAAAIGGGIRIGNALLPARVVAISELAPDLFALAIAAAGTNGPALGDAVRAAQILCVTGDFAAVQAGFCTMAINTDLRVDIVLNHAVAAASHVVFAAAFRMMIREF